MVNRIMLVVGAFAAHGFAGVAFGEEPTAPQANMTVTGSKAKFSVEYRTELEYNDHGLTKVSGGADPDKSGTIDLDELRIVLSGDMSERAQYKVKYDFLNDSVHEARIVSKFSDMIDFTIGQDKIHQGGYDQKFSGYKTLMKSYYNRAEKPFKSYAPVIGAGVNFGAGGALNIQLTDDVTQADNPDYFEKNHRQPAAIFEWTGTFGPVKPLLQCGLYDGVKHSRFYAVGLLAEISELQVIVDVILDSREFNKNPSVKTDYKSNVVDVSYSMPGRAQAFVKVATYDVSKPGTGVTANSATPAAEYVIDDNVTNLAVGAKCFMCGSTYVPYLAVVVWQGKYFKSATSSDTESRRGSELKLGVMGEF